jgi:hypothetical protein
MNTGRQLQRGASMWMVMIVLGILGFGLVFGLKLIPLYLDWWAVEKAVAGALQAGVESSTKREITTSIVRRLDIDGVYNMTEANLNEFMTIRKSGRNVTVEIDYEGRAVLVGNVSIVAHFEKTVAN